MGFFCGEMSCKQCVYTCWLQILELSFRDVKYPANYVNCKFYMVPCIYDRDARFLTTELCLAHCKFCSDACREVEREMAVEMLS